MDHSPKKLHKCTNHACDKSFSRPGRLQQHMRTHTGDRPYVCSFSSCEKSYTRSQHLTRHIELSHSEQKGPATLVICIHCEQKFSSAYSLRKHEKQIHGDEKYYKCSLDGCPEMFRKRHQLKAHLFAHKGVKPFQCHIEGCQRQFSQSSHLERHLNRHESGYVCKEAGCNLSLPNMSSLRKHKSKSHKRTFHCNDCEKSFHKKSGLQSHVREHNEINEKIKCSHCDRSYFDKRNLTAHIIRNHKGVKFPCDICGQHYVTKQKLQSHLKQCGKSSAQKAKPNRRKGVDMSKRLCKYISAEKHLHTATPKTEVNMTEIGESKVLIIHRDSYVDHRNNIMDKPKDTISAVIPTLTDSRDATEFLSPNNRSLRNNLDESYGSNDSSINNTCSDKLSMFSDTSDSITSEVDIKVSITAHGEIKTPIGFFPKTGDVNSELDKTVSEYESFLQEIKSTTSEELCDKLSADGDNVESVDTVTDGIQLIQ